MFLPTAMRFICVINCCHLTLHFQTDWGHMEVVKEHVPKKYGEFSH